MGFALLGKQFILLWLGSSYIDSWLVGLVVMIPLIVPLSQTVGISILQAKKLHAFRSVMYLCISVLNIAVSVLFARRYGVVGAAFGTTLSLVTGNILTINLYYHFKVGLNIPRFFKELLRNTFSVMLVSFAAGILILFLPGQSWLMLMVRGALFSGIYFTSMWLYGMNDYEKSLISGLFKVFSKVKPHIKNNKHMQILKNN